MHLGRDHLLGGAHVRQVGGVLNECLGPGEGRVEHLPVLRHHVAMVLWRGCAKVNWMGSLF